MTLVSDLIVTSQGEFLSFFLLNRNFKKCLKINSVSSRVHLMTLASTYLN